MKRKGQVNLFLVIIVVIAIIIAIFALCNKGPESSFIQTEHISSIRELNDTIRVLRDDITRYKSDIERIDLERNAIREQLKRIIEDNEKTDSELANGDWDVNLRFLTDFLSEDDTVGERHRCDYIEIPAH